MRRSGAKQEITFVVRNSTLGISVLPSCTFWRTSLKSLTSITERFARAFETEKPLPGKAGWPRFLFSILVLLAVATIHADARRAPRDADKGKAASKRTQKTPPEPVTPAEPPTSLSRKYSFALYQIRYSTHSTSPTTVFLPRKADGSCSLTHLPLYGAGPWMDSTRSQSHREAFGDMVRAGINIALVQYPSDTSSRMGWGRVGLDMASQAIREMRASNATTPALGLYLDFIVPPNWDLSRDADRSQFFSVIREFYRRVPPAYRALVATANSGDMPDSLPVFLSAPKGIKGISAGFVSDLRNRFRREFGVPLALAGESAWKASASNMDAYFDLNPSQPLGMNESGPLHTAVLTPSYNERGLMGSNAPILARLNGRPYVAAWNDVGNKSPDWVILNSWNGWFSGSELAPSREAGDRDLNLTRAALAHLDSDAQYRARLIQQSVPSAMQPGSLSRIEFRVENAGVQPWPQSLSLLRYEWLQGTEVVASGNTSLLQTIRPREEHSAGLLVPARAERGDLPEGDYQLRFTLLIPKVETTPAGTLSLGTYAVHVGKRPEMATLLSSDLPLLLQPGPTYHARVRIRNDGGLPWTHTAFSVSYRWKRVSDVEKGGGISADVATDDSVSLKTPLKVDVPPGALVDLTADVAATGTGDKPLDDWTSDLPWHYELEWIITGPQGEAATQAPETVEVVENDVGIDFPLGSGLPIEVSADSPTDMKVVVRNAGPEKWKKGEVSIGFRWYYWDGVPMNKESARVPVEGPLGDLGPGEQALVRVPVQSPPFGGLFLLAAEAYRNGRWATDYPATRGTVILPQAITVKEGGLQPLDLSELYNFDGIAPDSLLSDGNFDGQGDNFPGQFLPPLVTPQQVRSTLYPCGYLGPVEGFGLDANRRIPFEYPAKQDGKNNMMVCSGQALRIRVPRCTALHLLMASDEDEDADWILNYEQGPEQRLHLSISSWDKPPSYDNESIGFYSPVRNGKSGVEKKDTYLKHYVLTCDTQRTLTQVTFPDNAHIKLVAMTVESW
jgi:hypothetical protein